MFEVPDRDGWDWVDCTKSRAWVDMVLPVEPTAVQVMNPVSHHGRPVPTVVPVAMATEFAMTTNVEWESVLSAAICTVQLQEVAVVVTYPAAYMRSVIP